MTSFKSFLAAACLVGSASVAHAGSGTVQFELLSFHGPSGSGPIGAGADRSLWNTGSSFNGVHESTLFDYEGSAESGFGDAYFLTRGDLALDPGTGLGPSGVSFIYDYAGSLVNLISFSSPGFSGVSQGEAFTLGTIAFTNGQWFGSGATTDLNTPSFFTYRITTTSADGAEFNQVSYGAIRVTVNAPLDNDLTTLAGMDAEADWITIYDLGQTLESFSAGFSDLLADPSTSDAGVGSFRVYDQFALPAGFTNSGTVDLIGMFNSLDLVGLDNARGGFITAGSTPLPPVVPGGAVPEPATWATMIAGFAMAGSTMRRRRAAFPARA